MKQWDTISVIRSDEPEVGQLQYNTPNNPSQRPQEAPAQSNKVNNKKGHTAATRQGKEQERMDYLHHIN